MAKLTSKARNDLPAGDFALSGGRYPIPDRSHAANAKARAQQQFEAGSLSSADRAKVFRKADAKLATKRCTGGRV